VHRDVKPANALLASQDHVYLTDFGLTKRAASGSAMTKTGQLVGTVDYVAPEQVEGGPVDARTDVYSLACVLYHLLTGKVPFDKPTEMAKLFAHVHEDPPRPSDLAPGTPGPLDDVVWRGMAKEASKRDLSAGDLGRAALAAAEHKSLAEPERSVARGEAAGEIASAPTVQTALPSAGTEGTVPATGVAGTVPATPVASGARRRNIRIGAGIGALVVLGGVVGALVSGGGSGSGGGATYADKLPPGGTMTLVTNAKPPKAGDEVLAAGKTNVKGVYYQVVVTRPKTKGAKGTPAPVYFNEYLGKKPKLLQRFKVPVQFFKDSIIANFKIEANPDPNEDKTAGIAFSWYHHLGDQQDETKYYGVTTHGIQLY
jgi:hypothetical protein